MKTLVNVAPSSTEGHFVKKAKQVVLLDEINETFLVEGESELITKNHTTLIMSETCLITCQNVYNAFEGIYRKALD